MSQEHSIIDVAGTHPVVSILVARKEKEPGAYDEDGLLHFLQYELALGSQKHIPYCLTDFFTDYINYSIVQYLRVNRGKYGPRRFRFNMRNILDQMAKLAFVDYTTDKKITEAMVNKLLPTDEVSEKDEEENEKNEENLLQPDVEFRTFGILTKEEDSNKRVVYTFSQKCVQEYLVALFLANECHRKVSNGRDGHHIVSTTMREVMRKLPTSADIWRIAFGLMNDEKRSREAQKHIMKGLIEEAKSIELLSPFDITNLCVEAIYESQNAGELTELLDDFALNQTIRYSNEYLNPARLPYAVSAVGYLVRASGNIYGVHMSNFGLGPKNIGMLADPVNDVSDNNLQVLNLSLNPLGSSGVKGLLRFIVKATLLSHLDLGSCQLGNVGMALVSEFFMCMPLRYLRLSDNNISDSGVKRVVRNFKFVSTLEWLDLNDNRITDKGAEMLGKGLVLLPNLRSLDLRGNKIGDDGAAAISESMAKLNQVTQLMLADNEIGEKGACKLSSHVWKTKSLRYVNLSLNNIPAEGIMGLRKAAKDHGELNIAVSSQSRSSLDITRRASEGEMVISAEDRADSASQLHTMSSVNLLEGRSADFDRHRPIRRSWSGRASFRRSWHGLGGSFRKLEAL